MSRLLVTALGMVVALAMSSTAFAQSAAEKGMKVYTEQKCSMCHSIDGKGSAKEKANTVGICTEINVANLGGTGRIYFERNYQ